MRDTVILLATHKPSNRVIGNFDCFVGSDCCDFYVLHHSNSEEYENKSFVVYNFTDDVLWKLGYTPLAKTLLPGSNHFGLLSFFRERPYYDYYWYIEDDVIFNGSWLDFVEYFRINKITSDFLSCYITDHEDQPQWMWWSAISFQGKTIPQEYKVRSFNPIYRISNRALKLVDEKLKQGWYGHHEVVIATLLKNSGMSINDFGGIGKYVLPGHENFFYRRDDQNILNDTMRCRPKISLDEIRERLLYHPLKIYR